MLFSLIATDGKKLTVVGEPFKAKISNEHQIWTDRYRRNIFNIHISRRSSYGSHNTRHNQSQRRQRHRSQLRWCLHRGLFLRRYTSDQSRHGIDDCQWWKWSSTGTAISEL